MKITNFLYDEEHAIRYVNNCIIRLNGNLIYTTSSYKTANGEFKIYYYELPIIDRDQCSFILNKKVDVEWNIGRLGFINFRNSRDDNRCPYITRSNKRIWKLGLSKSNVIIDSKTCKTIHPITFDYLYTNRSCIDSINGKYPSLQEIKDSGYAFAALSRNFAINIATSELFSSFHKNDSIGKLEKETFIIEEKYYYLLEQAEKDGLKCKF